MVLNIGFPIYAWDARIHRFGHILERVSNRLPSYNDPFGVLECVVLDAFWNGFGAVYYLRTFGLGCENQRNLAIRRRPAIPFSEHFGAGFEPSTIL